MSENNLKQLRVSECLDFANGLINRVKNASNDEIFNALCHLAVINVAYGCTPGADRETRQVLAIYQIEVALNAVADAPPVLDKAIEDFENDDALPGIQ